MVQDTTNMTAMNVTANLFLQFIFVGTFLYGYTTRSRVLFSFYEATESTALKASVRRREQRRTSWWDHEVRDGPEK